MAFELAAAVELDTKPCETLKAARMGCQQD